MASLNAEQLVDASAKAKLEVRQVAEKLAVARANENKANQENNSLRSQVEDLSKQLDQALAAQIQIDRAHAGEVANLKNTIAEQEDAYKRAAKAEKALAPQTAKAEKAAAKLADLEVEAAGSQAEIARLQAVVDELQRKLYIFKDAVAGL